MMAPSNGKRSGQVVLYNKGAWTAEEDAKLSQYIELHGPKKWKTIANNSGLKRCGKSCRLRWLNYLRPNIKRGNISSDEADLILRLHKLLGNRWALIAGRIPGRTDNEIKNYWNSHLSKQINQTEIHATTSRAQQAGPYIGPKARAIEEECINQGSVGTPINFNVEDMSSNYDVEKECVNQRSGDKFINFDVDNMSINYDVDGFFDFLTEGTYGLDWVNTFLEQDDDQIGANAS